MTELTIRELESVGKLLQKVIEIDKQNDEYENPVALDLPDQIAITRGINGIPLGHIQYSGNLEEYVFLPVATEREAPKWTVPLPPPF